MIPKVQRNIGVHFSGTNTSKTCIICTSGSIAHNSFQIDYCFDKIGPTKIHFSDDRVFEIVNMFQPEILCVDCPISLPPCVSCERIQCSGPSLCDDLDLAYLFSLGRKFKAPQNKKPIVNPQVHRVWDLERLEYPVWSKLEPTFNLNHIPLSQRVKILQKRLNFVNSSTHIAETNVLYSLCALAPHLEIEPDRALLFSNFELGLEIRTEIVEELFHNFDISCDEEEYEKISISLEVFQAFITAIISALFKFGSSEENSVEVDSYNGILLPKIDS